MAFLVYFAQFLSLVLFHLHFDDVAASSSSFFLNSSSPFSSAQQLRCPLHQTHALLQIKASFSISRFASFGNPFSEYDPYTKTESEYDPYPKTESWKEDTDCCLWDGVSCDLETGNVIGLNLSFSMLYGTFHSHNSLFLLSHLQNLDLSHNDFNNSVIPSQFGHLFNLRHLNLNFSRFAGQVPPQISHLSNLISLDLYRNDLRLNTDVFDRINQNMTNLRELILSWADMSMVAPSSFANLSSSLSSLHLDSCNLPEQFLGYVSLPNSLVSLDLSLNHNLKLDTARFNKIIRNLTKLRELDLSGVHMSMVAPTFFMNLSSSLTSLILSSCSLRGKVPANIVQRPNLEWLGLKYNLNLTGLFAESNWSSSLKLLDVSGTNIKIILVPDFIANLRSLKYLYLDHSHFHGSNLALFGDLLELQSLGLSHNNLLEIPSSFGNLQQLRYLDLSFNNFASEIPSSFGNLQQLRSFDLRSNNFTGEIPSSFGNLQQLEYLNLWSNNFNGEIPSSFGNLQQLRSLDLSINNFTGEIPSSFGNLQQLSFLDLSSNNFSGAIPSSFANLQQLNYLHLYNNSLTGLLPRSIFTLPNLRSLLLHNNEFYRAIDQFKSNSLSEINLSNNMLQGLIPSSIFTQLNLHYLSLKNNQFYGQIGKFESKSIFFIDLRNNKLQGLIPGSLFNLPYLKVLILSSNNKLMGKLSPSICNLKSLEILDLSDNDLTGFIPQCIGNFSDSLSVLHIGGNSFEGVMPMKFSSENSLRYLNFNGNPLQGQISSVGA